MIEAINSTTSGIYRKGWAALAVKAAGKLLGSRIENSEFAKLMTMAERELGSFISAVTELFGSEQARLATEDWLDELVLMETLPGLTSRDWRLITIAASARLANRVRTSDTA